MTSRCTNPRGALHGVTPPEPYLRADGAKNAGAPAEREAAPLTKAKAKKVDEERPRRPGQDRAGEGAAGQPHPVQEELKVTSRPLEDAWISKDPGDPSSVNDPESQARSGTTRKST